MLVQKFYYRELVSNATKILGVLAILLPVVQLFQLLDGVNRGKIPVFILFNLVVETSLASFPMILQIACFFAVIVTLNRYCKDSEFVVWLGSGLSNFYWLRITFIFTLPIAIICGICSLYLTPWATLHSQQYAHYLSSQQLNKIISPGNFRQSLTGGQVFYVDQYLPQSNLVNKLFLQYTGRNNVIYNLTAQNASLFNESGTVKAQLRGGHIYQVSDSVNNIISIDFNELSANVENKYVPLTTKQIGVSSYPTGYLLSSLSTNPAAKVELGWRISIIIMLIATTIIVVPLSIQIGRMQKSVLLFISAPVISAIYQNFALVGSGNLDQPGIFPIVKFIAIHSSLFIAAIILTYIKTFPKGYFRLFKL